jgi:hypothetical protein
MGNQGHTEPRSQGIRLRFSELQVSWDDTLLTDWVRSGHVEDVFQVLTPRSAPGMHCGSSISGRDGKAASEGHW